MRSASSSPSHSPVTTSNESLASSPPHSEPRPHSDPISSTKLPASPTPAERSSLHSMSATQSKRQPNSPSQNATTTLISANSHLSCVTPSEHSAHSSRNQPTKSPPQSGTVSSFPATSRQSITPSFSFPDASKSPTAYDQAFLNNTAITTSSSEPTSVCQQTPNVYINGLPPHCSEQDLFALARPFGDIKSVRTFTRHVSEKPTGYGFVLFNDVASAQRCIEGLRKHRSLHPSFSKQMHRIPGTEYAQQNVQSVDQDENSFKARMEKLKDMTSTNLYIEGLPLSIDAESLAALVAPHKIKSSRFFKTKLSNPPRIIAFVRLETRAAAEDTIERLHGRMVRGWNDPGCRISVRFADSAEQRELRRTERTSKHGDQSPSRLTIAQASLLSLRGQDLQASARGGSECKPQRVANSCSDINLNYDPGLLPISRSLPSAMCHTRSESPFLATSHTSEMDTLIQSIQNGYDDESLESTMRSLALDNEYLLRQQAQLRALASAAMLTTNPHRNTLPRGPTQACNGFTPAEELILETHAQHFHPQVRVAQTSATFDPMSTLGQPNATTPIKTRSQEPFQTLCKGKPYQDSLPTISEHEFHAMGHLMRGLGPISHEDQGTPSSIRLPASTLLVRPSSRAVSIVPPPPGYEETGGRGKSSYQQPKQTTYNQQSISAGGGNPRPNENHIDENPSNLCCDKMQHTYMHSQAAQVYPKKPAMYCQQQGLRSPVVVSPALTYSSRTPSTLSPATPFFGSFTGSQDGLEVVTMDHEEVGERRLKGRVVAKN